MLEIAQATEIAHSRNEELFRAVVADSSDDIGRLLAAGAELDATNKAGMNVVELARARKVCRCCQVDLWSASHKPNGGRAEGGRGVGWGGSSHGSRTEFSPIMYGAPRTAVGQGEAVA